MHCCAHILNLIVKDELEIVKDEKEKIRDSVAYWNAISKRKEKFEESTKQLRVLHRNLFNRLRHREKLMKFGFPKIRHVRVSTNSTSFRPIAIPKY
ncbi:hypothetical protein Lal_00042426 [Lupinus albus]|nr:hypothetical protein Lal_00042426 [Lupinus albus]